MAEVMLTK
jgi:hypothetical protein